MKIRGYEIKPYANLYGADLRWANLYGADLRWANLHGADLRGANLYGADLRDTRGIGSLTVVPPEGDVIGWKKCKDGVIVKLLVPAEARRSNSTTRKCRAEYVRVLEVIGADVAYSLWDTSVVYVEGITTECHRWEENRWLECTGGIHFFIDRQEAEEFNL